MTKVDFAPSLPFEPAKRVPFPPRAGQMRAAPMPIKVQADEAQAQFSGLLAKAGAGEEVMILRGDALIAQLIPFDHSARRRAPFEQIIATRDSGRIQPVTQEEILAWRHEGHRY